MRTLAPKYGLTIVTSESFAIDDTNFNAQLTRIRAANPDIIYSSATGRAAILIFKQFKQMGLTTPLVVSQAAVSKAFFDAIDGPAAANGLLSPNQLGAFGTKMGGDTARLYLELEKALGRLPVYFNTFGYDTGLILGAAMAHSDGSRQGLRDAMEKLKDLPAVSGPVTYSPDNHTGQDFRSIAIGKLENGVAVPVE
jgi:branched-chain amino acid transport system substrate-binding protein